MGSVIQFPRHARTSKSRAAKPASLSAVKPALWARSVRKMGTHHSAGIVLRWGHLRTPWTPAPISTANASGESHSATTSRKFETMNTALGQSVLNCKAKMSLDDKKSMGQAVLMDKQAFKIEFGNRLRTARGSRTTEVVAKSLKMDQSGYSKYENGEREMPLHRAVEFCEIYEVDIVWLLQGPKRKRATG